MARGCRPIGNRAHDRGRAPAPASGKGADAPRRATLLRRLWQELCRDKPGAGHCSGACRHKVLPDAC
jgi:hypothetical protein